VADFKSNRLPPDRPADIPKAYLRQLGLYRLLLQQIYPGKTVRATLIWTVGPKVTALPDALLDEEVLSTYIY
jgi:ATP-dependent helicase/nuclease subunit A